MLVEYRKKNFDEFLGKRIGDLMKENKVSPTFLAESVDMTRSTVNRIIKEGRTVKESELIAIAKFFRITTERLTMEDTINIVKNIEEMIQRGTKRSKILEETTCLIESAIGNLEKACYRRLHGIALNLNGFAKEATSVLNDALEYAEKCMDETIIKGVANTVIFDLLTKRHYSECKRAIDKYVQMFEHDLLFRAKAHFSLAHCYAGMKNAEGEKEELYKAIHLYDELHSEGKVPEGDNNIGKIRIHLATLVSQEDVNCAKALLLDAVNLLGHSPSNQAIAYKELSRISIFVEDNESALNFIETAIEQIVKQSVDIPEIYAKLLLQKAFITNDVSHALEASQIEKISNKTLVHAYDTIAMMYNTLGEYQLSNMYFIKIRSCSPEKIVSITQL